MLRARNVSEIRLRGGPCLGDLLTARPSGLTEPESWAILCQAVQALQDLFLSDGASGGSCVPLVTPSTLLLSSRGRVKLYQSPSMLGCGPPAHLTGYIAPEYRFNKQYTDTDTEKMWIYSLGETLKRATLTSHAATSRLSGELCQILADMTRSQAPSRASLMHLLDVISDYCKKQQQNRPFSHIVMDLHQEAMAALEMTLDTPWGPPAMPEIMPRAINRCDSHIDAKNSVTSTGRWVGLLSRLQDVNKPKLTREVSTSMEDLPFNLQTPGALERPKSMCVPDVQYFNKNETFINKYGQVDSKNSQLDALRFLDQNYSVLNFDRKISKDKLSRPSSRRLKSRRNPVQRAASRLYRASGDFPGTDIKDSRECVGPEFVVRATLPNKQITMPDIKGSFRKVVTVIMLNGQKLDVLCNPNTTTAGQLFEQVIKSEQIEENFMLGVSALIAGDFVFLPSDTRICKAMSGNNQLALTLFIRVRFFLPSLRGIRSLQALHLLYLQLRRSILEHQLPCSFDQLVELDGFALQAEFGDFSEREHGARDYFLLEHYVPETMTCAINDSKYLQQELIKSHMSKAGIEKDKAEKNFISLAQTLAYYGGHFYTATWVLKDGTHKDIWLYISAQGINLYQRGNSTSHCGPLLYELFEWKNIQTLCYSKHYLCILPHTSKLHKSKLKKYKLKMDNKKSYFTFRLASLHHQFFLRLNTEYTSLHTLSQHFGIQLKDMKNETNSLYKLEALTNPDFGNVDKATVNAETEFKIDFSPSVKNSPLSFDGACKRSKSANDFTKILNTSINEDFQNKENENPQYKTVVKCPRQRGLVLDSSCLSGLPVPNVDKRRGVKMGIRAFSNVGQRISRSMEAVNGLVMNDELDHLSLQSVSLHCSSPSISGSPATTHKAAPEVYILDSTIKSCSNQFLPDFQETLSESLMEKLNNISFAEERVLKAVCIERDSKGSLGIQITEGSDGKVYIQSVIPNGPAYLAGNIHSGDQIIAVDGLNILNLKYDSALELLKNTGQRVEFILSQLSGGRKNMSSRSTLRISDIEMKAHRNLTDIDESHLKSLRLENTMNKLKRMSYPSNINPSVMAYNSYNYKYNNLSENALPFEKYLTESCHDISNSYKYGAKSNGNTPTEVPYHKHIRYEIEAENDVCLSSNSLPRYLNIPSVSLNKNISKSCNHISGGNENNKAIVVDIVPKSNVNINSLNRKPKEGANECNLSHKTSAIPPIALPRSLGLSRKWRGPVRYPVTPIKKLSKVTDIDNSNYVTTSDEEQVFI